MEKGKKSLFFAAVVFSLFTSSFVLAIDDPIAHWKLDETSGLIAEDSAGDNDGTLINGPVWTTGIIDGALEFDNVDDYVEVGDPPDESLDFGAADSFTVAAWIKCDDVGGYSAIVSKRECTGLYGYFYEGYNFGVIGDGTLTFGIEDTSNAGVTLYGNTAVADNQWHHVVAVRNVADDKIYIYVDGNSDVAPMVDTTSGTLATSQDLWIGLRTTTLSNDPLENPHYFSGLIDDVRIYDRALSAEEIQWLYLGEQPELVGLEITGPDEAAEDSQTQYSAIALYDNNSTKDVTDDALWSVEPNVIAGIEAGLLTTEKIFQPEELEIYAQYTEDSNTFDANKPVSVFAICPSGTALEFDGLDDYVNLGIEPDLQPSLPVTISAWVKLESLDEHKFIFSLDKELYWHSGIWLQVLNQRHLHIAYGDGGYSGPSSRRSKNSTSVLDTGIWYHVAAVLVGPTDLTLYINGEDDGGVYGGTGGDLAYRNKESFIGTLSTDRHFFDGIIDEVAIYNRALSAQEIQMNMHVPLEGNEPNLVAYWDFDEGEGQVAHDMSGNGNDGQLGSSPDIDDSDPNWVDSDVPVGICTLEELVERNVNEALEIKLNILDEILEALAREDASVNILGGMFGGLDYGHLDKRDIRRARQEIHSAIQSEEQAIHSVEKSVGDLEDSLDILAGEDGAESNSISDNKVTERLLVPSKK